MRFSTGKVAVLALALCQSTYAYGLKATILADTNRDGKVDVKGDSDIKAKTTWTAERGALFLANIGDTDQRCSKKWGPSREIPFEDGETYLDECNDAIGDVQRNPKYLAPLRTLPIAKLSASAKGRVHVTNKVAASKVRIFVKEGTEWTYVGANYTFTAEDLKGGLELGVDARDVRRPNGWDGKAQVHFTVSDGAQKATDSVALRVAPVLTHHHAQLAERVFSTDADGDGAQGRFVADLEKNTAAAGIDEPVFLFDHGDIWTQDFFEPGYSSIPGPDGPIVLRVMIRSVQASRSSGRDIFHQLRNDKVGAVQHHGDGDTIDSTGNLETIPPYKYKGKSYPAGRVIQGQWEGRKPLMFNFLKAQQVQDPVALDTAWLAVGHVDEFLQFLPSDNKRGWVVVVDDPVAGVELLKKASREGHGSMKALSRPHLPGEDPVEYCLPKETIDQVLKLEKFESINKMAAKRIEGNIAILKRETGLTDDEILRVPATFYYAYAEGGWTCSTTNSTGPGFGPTVIATPGPSATPSPSKLSAGSSLIKKAVQGGPVFKAKSIIEAAQPHGSAHLGRREVDPLTQLVAFYPGTVNGVVLADSFVLAPNPWGPVIDGEDIIAKAVQETYAQANFNVTFQDDWFSHHLGMGEVHCGTNTWRTTDTKWW
ncbi:hypothetical protein CDV31_009196 [Fusarium ambrosium]|uniref:Protein-arginine deiminase C-terminal domain-containing protein n=1 Tax=Fusarium ambrosium TaxID=131363 RepID=A0A428TWH2_9HYPO|nr:hypothetical protein CDV31_009196 [Fusarium ambrosium]